MLILIYVLSYDDEELLESLFDTLSAKMYNVAYKLLENPEDAEEAVQEAFVRIMNKIGRIQKLPCPERVPFCVVIVKNVSKNMRRNTKPQIYIDEVDYPVTDKYSDPQQEFFANADRAYLARTISSLAQKDKDVILMKWGKKMGYREIGKVLGISEDAAMKRGQRALKKLRGIYNEGASNG